MAKCAICEKGAHFGNNVSHSHRKTDVYKRQVLGKFEEAFYGIIKKLYRSINWGKSIYA